jgi:hypothetical protein
MLRQYGFHLESEPKDKPPSHLWNISNWVMNKAPLIGNEKSEGLSDKIRELRKSLKPLTK